jgi:dCTP deaminase
MILSDRDIRRRLKKGDLKVEPLDDPELQIQPASIDMRLGNEFLEFERSNIPCIHPESEEETDEYTRRRVVENGDDYVLHPGDFVLGTTYETVEIPDDLVARVEGRSSLGRLAVVVHATAGFVDPGYRGQITLELSNLGTAPVALRPEEMRISQLVLTELSSPAEEPYGKERGSKYQDQDGPTASRIGEDAEWKQDRNQTG